MKSYIVLLKLAISICLFVFSINFLSAQTNVTEISGNITKNITWDYDTVRVTGDIVVDENISLSVEPGTWIKFLGNYGIEIKGYLIAEGIPGDTIVFTRIDTVGFRNYSKSKSGL